MAPAYKRGVRRYEYVSLTAATHGDAVRVFYSSQSDSRNREYLFGYRKVVRSTFVNCEGPYRGIS